MQRRNILKTSLTALLPSSAMAIFGEKVDLTPYFEAGRARNYYDKPYYCPSIPREKHVYLDLFEWGEKRYINEIFTYSKCGSFQSYGSGFSQSGKLKEAAFNTNEKKLAFLGGAEEKFTLATHHQKNALNTIGSPNLSVISKWFPDHPFSKEFKNH